MLMLNIYLYDTLENTILELKQQFIMLKELNKTKSVTTIESFIMLFENKILGHVKYM